MGIENDLISVSRAKLTWFLCDGRKWLDFSVHYSVLFQGVAWDAADDSATATLGISAELIRRVH